MPEIKGTDKLIPPRLIYYFTTAYSDYLEGFELSAIDYLLNPLGLIGFKKQFRKLKKDVGKVDTITVKSGYDLFKLKYDEITHIE
jgi:DNA-binding LytR/AlgR family response regulator